MADFFSKQTKKVIEGPANSAVAVTPSDSTELDITRGVYVGTGGDLAVVMADDSLAVTFVAVPSGVLLPIRVLKVMSTNTTASDILALI